MAILDFQKPDKVIMINSDNFYGKFEFRPLELGYGMTIGNALRRVLLNSLDGFAITSVKIDGVDHEYSTIKGVREDVAEIIDNLKQVRFKQQIEDVNDEKVTVSISGQDTFSAGDIGNFTSAFQVVNTDHVVCHMEKNVSLKIELTIKKGRGYIYSEENKTMDENVGEIFIDSTHTPMRKVNYSIENYRVLQKTDYEKLVFEIETDGTIHPQEALTEAAKILIHHFMLFSDERIILESEEKTTVEEFDENTLHMRQLLKTKLVDLDLSVRALNCLKSADVETLGDLVQLSKNDLLKFRNFGKKSLTELDELFEMKSLHFGMDVSKYKLDKE